MRVAVVRESGGYGDCICAAGTCRQIKKEYPESTVAIFCPNEFLEVYKHCEGVDQIHSLGPVSEVSPRRRSRSATLRTSRRKYHYLQPLYEYKPDLTVDLWCPGAVHECSTVGPLLFNRNELFAMSAGCDDIRARARWVVTDEERSFAKKWIHELGVEEGKFIGLSLRGTCRARSYPPRMSEDLVSLLLDRLSIVYFDCVMPHFKFGKPGFHFNPRLPFSLAVAVASLSRMMVTVDSGMMHVAGALDKPSVVLMGPTDSVAARAYPKTVVVEATDTKCQVACNYNREKNWVNDKAHGAPCRKNGCRRLLRVSPLMVYNRVDSILENSDVRFV